MVLQGRVGSLKLGGKAEDIGEGAPIQHFPRVKTRERLKHPVPGLAFIDFLTNKIASGRNGLGGVRISSSIEGRMLVLLRKHSGLHCL